MKLMNRFMRSPTFEGLGDEEGRPTSRMLDLADKLAEGHVDLIVRGCSNPMESGRMLPRQIPVDTRLYPDVPCQDPML